MWNEHAPVVQGVFTTDLRLLFRKDHIGLPQLLEFCFCFRIVLLPAMQKLGLVAEASGEAFLQPDRFIVCITNCSTDRCYRVACSREIEI